MDWWIDDSGAWVNLIEKVASTYPSATSYQSELNLVSIWVEIKSKMADVAAKAKH